MKIHWLKYLASYFYLVTIKKIPSDYNPGLSIQMEAGKLLLNTKNANYSYGNLHKVFEDVFELMEIENSAPKNILILGLGAGSVIDILHSQYGFNPTITAIEIDPEIIKLLSNWAFLDLTKTEIICGDAFKVINNLKSKYDLIIVDLFIDLEVHPEIHDNNFIQTINNLLTDDGTALINYVVNTKVQKAQFANFQIVLMTYFKNIKGHEIMGMNRVLEIKKS